MWGRAGEGTTSQRNIPLWGVVWVLCFFALKKKKNIYIFHYERWKCPRWKHQKSSTKAVNFPIPTPPPTREISFSKIGTLMWLLASRSVTTLKIRELDSQREMEKSQEGMRKWTSLQSASWQIASGAFTGFQTKGPTTLLLSLLSSTPVGGPSAPRRAALLPTPSSGGRVVCLGGAGWPRTTQVPASQKQHHKKCSNPGQWQTPFFIMLFFFPLELAN